MLDPPFSSWASNRQDVVLWRALGRLHSGHYLDVSDRDPFERSASRGFYERGWQGVVVEADATRAAQLRSERPRDVIVQVSVPQTRLDDVLGEAGAMANNLSFMHIEMGAVTHNVLKTVDLKRWRPWALVIESVDRVSNLPTHVWEESILAHDYLPCLFDGVFRFYAAAEHGSEIAAFLAFPVQASDAYTTPTERKLRRQIAELEASCASLSSQLEGSIAETIRWRGETLLHWGESVNDLRLQRDLLAAENAAIRQTVSWRVTWPLRSSRGVLGALRHGLRERG